MFKHIVQPLFDPRQRSGSDLDRGRRHLNETLHGQRNIREEPSNTRQLGGDLIREEIAGTESNGARGLDRDHDVGREAQVPRTLGLHLDDLGPSELPAEAEDVQGRDRAGASRSRVVGQPVSPEKSSEAAAVVQGRAADESGPAFGASGREDSCWIASQREGWGEREEDDE